jgi:uncharacterized protein
MQPVFSFSPKRIFPFRRFELDEIQIAKIRSHLGDEDWINPKAELSESGSRGAGLYAKQPIEERELVIVWGCAYHNRSASEKAVKEGKYVMQWDDDLFTIDDGAKTTGYYMNHSCSPNLGMAGPYALIALRDISAGEELCPDYAMWEADEDYISTWSCACGSPNCRKKVTGLDWRSPELQERYRGYFSPLLDKRIGK